MKRIAVIVGLHLAALGAAIAIISGVARPQTVTAPGPQPPSQQVPQPAPAVASPSALQSRCEAAGLAYLVGKPRTEIPVPVNLTNRRVSCTSCPVTEDYRPDRTDILFDAQTGLIVAVKCG